VENEVFEADGYHFHLLAEVTNVALTCAVGVKPKAW
jgi:hypothetical protein